MTADTQAGRPVFPGRWVRALIGANVLRVRCQRMSCPSVSLVVRGSSRFHLYSTHAGPVSGAIDNDPAGRAQLNRILKIVAAKAKPLPEGVQLPCSAVIDAYARLGVNPSDIPNTARLLAEEARHRGLMMTAVLIDDAAEAELRGAFPAFRVLGARGRSLSRLRSYDAPWVFSVAPAKVAKRPAGAR